MQDTLFSGFEVWLGPKGRRVVVEVRNGVREDAAELEPSVGLPDPIWGLTDLDFDDAVPAGVLEDRPSWLRGLVYNGADLAKQKEKDSRGAENRSGRKGLFLFGGLLMLSLAAGFFADWRHNSGFNDGVDAGMAWQLDYGWEMRDCMDRQRDSFVEHRRSESPGAPEDVILDEFYERYEEGVRYVCQGDTIAVIGEPPSREVGWNLALHR